MKSRTADIGNKIKRNEVYHKEKQLKNKLKTERRKRAAAAASAEGGSNQNPKQVPKTLESKREFDESIGNGNGIDDEVKKDFENDEFNNYFNQSQSQSVAPDDAPSDASDKADQVPGGGSYSPKLLITTSKRPSKPVYEFANEFTSIFPNAHFVKRASCFDVKKVVEIAIERAFTDLLIINHDRKEPNAVTIIHLPNGPTAHFNLTSILLNKDIRAHGKLGPHLPELILNNFSTSLGARIGRMFAALFPPVPEFAGRQACTLHNQRDFIFFRRHRYIFRRNAQGVAEKTDIQELGPRFTLKLKWLQRGTFDRKNGEFEWVHKPELDTSRTKFHL